MNVTPTLLQPILLFHPALHPSFRVVRSSGTLRSHLPAIHDQVPTLATVRPPLDEVPRSRIALPFMKSGVCLQAFPAHLLAFTPGPRRCPPLLPRVRFSTLRLQSHISRLNLQHPMATQNRQRIRRCRRLRRKLGLHRQQDPLVLRNRLLQPVGVKSITSCLHVNMFVGTVPKGLSFLSSPPITTATSNRSPEPIPSPMGTKPSFVKKILDSLNAPSSIGLFNVSRRQSLKHASHEKSPRRSEQSHSVVTKDSSEGSSSNSSGHRSGSGGSKGGDYRGSSASNGRSDTSHGPTDEKVSSITFYSHLYLPFSSLSGLVTFGTSTSTGKNLISGSAVAPYSFEHTFNYPGSSEVVVGRSSTSICSTATKSAPYLRHFTRLPGMTWEVWSRVNKVMCKDLTS